MGKTATRETTWADVVAAVRAIAAARWDLRDEWIRIGMAIHAFSSSPEALELWREGSRQSEKFDERTLVQQWYSFKPDRGVTPATLFGLADEDSPGWRDALRGAADDAPKNGTSHASPPPERETRAAPAKEEPPKPKKQFWADLETAKKAFEGLPRVIDDPEALEFMASEYSLSEMELCDGVFAEWRVMEYPRLGRGVVYPGVSPTGQPSFKWKSFARTPRKSDPEAPGKRETRGLYYPDTPTGPWAFHVKRPSSPLVIVCGEEKAVTAYAAGFSVLSPMTGESKLDKRWAQWVAEADPPAVILANDADEAGAKANDAMAGQVADAGYPRLQIHRVAWPEGLPAGWDLNDAKKAGQDVRAMLSEAEPVQRDRLTILTVGEILDRKAETNDNLLGAYMLVKGGPRYSLVVGPPSIGKSRLVVQMAIDVTCGFDFCGLESHGKGTRWLFFQAENRHRRLQSDFGSMLRGSDDWVRKAVRENICALTPMTEADMFLKFGLPGVEQRLKDAVQAFNPDVIVWDPLIEFFGGESENANVEMKECISQMMRISRARRADTAVLILAHASPGKAATAKAYGFDALHFHRGASSLIGAAGASFNIAQADEDDPNRLIMACGKCSDGPKFDPRGLVLDPDRMRYAVDPEFDLEQWKEATRGNGKTAGGNKRWDETIVFSRVNPGETVPFKDLAESISETHNMKKVTIWRRVQEMGRAGILTVEKRTDMHGSPIFITRPE